MKKNQAGQTGFTLIELLIVIALVSISLGVTTDILLSLIRNFSKSSVITEVEAQANFVALKLEKELRNASSVTAANGGTQLIFTVNGISYCYYATSSNIFRSTTCVSTVANALIGTVAVGSAQSPAQTLPYPIEMSCDGTCFSVTGTRPAIVSISLLFRSYNPSNINTYRGEVHVRNVIVARNTY